ncbi:UDP-N-acetylglucosamine 2-epimerase (non-hydrolyzing) [Desulfuromonas sp. AOP6]|uniref:non-hydrolyzing UDP-N-acetylglucosamine 2-epimerase n=1 Tax=Desulfuromonas sp. AOP6 TaxID=1566351 RepID=UPI001274A09B|nr:UDP-N-acetylglucosamine 2-epimerase (non-hydrolyzing) [Desulfuromonas sp. AOP6]BCA80078.1 UDP-N-acetyl glucosamine 2-epimerase [Desulfuromonas sp. AOP6]
MRIKVMTIVGTRPEIIKLCRVIHELDCHTDHILVHSGQNYDFELNEIFFQQLGIRKPDYFLNAVGDSVAQTIGNVIAKADEVMAQVDPDAVLLLGDTNSCLSAISAKRRKVPIFHMEAGNRCFDLRVPEEINRKIVDHLSDINLTYTEHARRYLLAEGLRPETVLKTGSPMKEVLQHYQHSIESSDVLESLELEAGEYFVVSAHREENVDSDENFTNLLETLNAIAKHYDRPIIFSTHPRTRKRLESRDSDSLSSHIRFLKPLGFFEYVKLQMHAKCVISDSGTITEESSVLNFPAVTIRQAHERPEGMDEGTLIMCGLQAERVIESLEVVIAQSANGQRTFRLVQDYDTDNVSHKVLRIILSYTEYVNRTVWKK